MEYYRVGGAVRDRLLGQPIHESDYVVVGSSPEVLIAKGFKPVGKDFPVFLHPDSHEEYALARTERKQGSGYKGFQICAAPEVTLEEDLKRRDLTINAIAETEDGKLVDPYDGYHDIKKKILRHVSSAFIEDPVRILRVARFMSRFFLLGFQIAPETMTLMKKMVENGEVNALVPERIWREFQKALSESTPLAFVTTLVQCGAWQRICPEWNRVSEDKQTQAFEQLEESTLFTKDPIVRFSSLMKFIALDAEDVEPAQSIVKRWGLPTSYKELLILSIRYGEKVHQSDKMLPQDLLDLLTQVDALRRKERFEKLLLVCEVDWKQRKAKSAYFQKERLLGALDTIQTMDLSYLKNLDLSGSEWSQEIKRVRQLALKEKDFGRSV